MKSLTIKLAAPLQAYGNEAAFSRRTSYDHPSKSAVLGLIAAALGYDRRDPRIVQLNDLAFAVRIDQPGKHLTDFQTVEWKPGTRKVTYRDLLQDAVFVAAIGSVDETFVDRIEVALHHPCYPLFLGRRANAPAGVLKTESFDQMTPTEALQHLDWQASEWFQKRHHQDQYFAEVFADADQSATVTNLVKDRIVSFDQRDRRYDYRVVQQFRVDLVNSQYQRPTEHDAFGSL